jgi:Flp pilus assembly protein TadD
MIREASAASVPDGAGWWKRHWLAPAVCLALAVITFAVFGRTAGFQFVNYDDNKYVYDNPVVERGLTLKGAAWAFTYGEIGHWHPLTWLSHMADCQVYGLWAGGHHLTNVALHTLAAMLLFLALREMTGSLWRSAFVAAVFAVHPLRAESVAWIAERKDVLSGVFFMLTLWVYARYARQPSRGRHLAALAAFALGLLSKNTLVPLPFLLLLLDWWPLQRLTPATLWRLVKEKTPLFLLSVGSCVATSLVPEKVPDAGRLSILDRIGNAAVSYGIYLRQMIFPAGLANPYPYPPNGLSFWSVALAFVLLAVISAIVVACRNKRPYLLVGWLWYAGMLVPMIGLVQISYYSHADRYTYLPGIGLALAGTWAVGDWSLRWKHRQAVLGGVAAMVIGVLMICAWKQTVYWQDSETLWTHTLKCTAGNSVAHYNLGLDLDHKGRVDEAIAHYQKALQIDPGYEDSHYSLGNAFAEQGQLDEAIAQFQKALQIDPGYADAHFNLGVAYALQHKTAEAMAHYRMALGLQPAMPAALNNLAWILATDPHAEIRNGPEAVRLARRACALTQDAKPVMIGTLAAACAEAGQFDEAIAAAQKAHDLAVAQGLDTVAAKNSKLLELFRAHHPCHEKL